MAGESYDQLGGCRKGGKPSATSFDLRLRRGDNGEDSTRDDRRDDMATVAEIDEKIGGYQALIEQLREQRKAAAAKERQQARKWRGMCLSAIGETVLRAVGCGWSELDLDGLQAALDDIGGAPLSAAVIEGRSPAEAKRALDAFKRSRREAKQDDADAGVEQQGPDEESVEDRADESEPAPDGEASQTNPW